MRDTLLLIDANSLIHRAYHALPPFKSPDGRPTGALYGLASILLKIFSAKGVSPPDGRAGASDGKEGTINNGVPRYVTAAFDRPEPTFRNREYKDYKGTRPRASDDLISQIVEARKLLNIFNIKCFEMPGWEADDIIMTLAAKFSDEKKLNQIIIFSGDLDLLQAVQDNRIILETPQKGISNTIIYDESAVVERFGVGPELLADFKGFVGDKSDNIPGLPGVGPKTAASLIKKFGSLENIYKEIDEVGLNDYKLQAKLVSYRDQAFLSKRLATLSRTAPIITDIDALQIGGLDSERVKNYFEDLGFSTLVTRLHKYYT
ncbi:MAG: hypothetical protein HYR95_00290 [Candidatus Colwellbacteria bacterium]|nr:hypothetical protein [Candidatus Colwellbacteria bacterium]MBI3273840.1 hypothetical protein [Candidatus Colwellbacteria bacterium]